MQENQPIDPDQESQTIRAEAGAAASAQIIALREEINKCISHISPRWSERLAATPLLPFVISG